MATLSILNVKNNSVGDGNELGMVKYNGNDDDSKDDSPDNTNQNLISIAFGNSLTLLSFKELLLLFKICKNQGILVKDIDKIDMKNAISQSTHDPRLIAYARDIHGVPYLQTWYNVMPQQLGQMIELLESGMDVNVKNQNKESIIFAILRNFDYLTLRYILTRYAISKKVDIHLNYFNRSGISPLCQALELFPQELQMKRFKQKRNNKHNKKQKHNLHLYEYLIDFGEVNLNDSIKRDGSSALGFAFNHVNNLKLISKLIERGAILNCQEISLLPQLYINMSLLDCETISPYNVFIAPESENKLDRVEKSIETKYKFMETRIHFLKKFAKYKELENASARSRKKRVVGGAHGGAIGAAVINALSSLNDMHDNTSKLSMLYHVIFKCKVHQSCIFDNFKNNPLHLFITNPVTNVNPPFLDDLIFEQCNVVTLLKFCCREWLYQENLDEETPFTIALKCKKESLLQTLLFDEVKALEYIDQLNELSKSLGEKMDDGVAKWKEKNIQAKYENNAGEAIVRNETLFKLLLLNKSDCKLLINWIIDLCSDVLSPYTRDISIEHLLPFEMSAINTENINNDRIVILDCEIESEVLEQYIDSSRSIRSKLSTLYKLLMMIDYKNIVYAGIEEEEDGDDENDSKDGKSNDRNQHQRLPSYVNYRMSIDSAVFEESTVKQQEQHHSSINLVSMCQDENKLYIIQFLNHFCNFSIDTNDKAAINQYVAFREKLFAKEREQIRAQKEEERLKEAQKEKAKQLQSELKAAVFAKIGVIGSKTDHQIKENETEYSVTFGDIKQIDNGLTFESLDGELESNMVVTSCDKDILNEENGMYVDDRSVIVEINGTYVYGLKTSKIKQTLEGTGDESSKGQTITIKFRVDKVVREARLQAFAEKQKQQAAEEKKQDGAVTTMKRATTTTKRRILSKVNFTLNDEHFIVYDYYQPLRLMSVKRNVASCEAIDIRKGKRVQIQKTKDAFQDNNVGNRILREVKLMAHFDHVDIVNLLDVIIPEPSESNTFNDVYLVTPKMETTLHRIIESQQSLSDQHYKAFMYQILRGLKYLHSADIVLRSLNPHCILVNGADCKIKIKHFRSAWIANGNEAVPATKLTNYKDSPKCWYYAPEMIAHPLPYDGGVDVWAAGCIFGELITRRPLFRGADYLDQLRLIFAMTGAPEPDVQWITRPGVKEWLKELPIPKESQFDTDVMFSRASTDAKALLASLLVADPSARMTAEAALSHDYLSNLSMKNATEETNCQAFEDFTSKEATSIATEAGMREVMYNTLVDVDTQIVNNEENDFGDEVDDSDDSKKGQEDDSQKSFMIRKNNAAIFEAANVARQKLDAPKIVQGMGQGGAGSINNRTIYEYTVTFLTKPLGIDVVRGSDRLYVNKCTTTFAKENVDRLSWIIEIGGQKGNNSLDLLDILQKAKIPVNVRFGIEGRHVKNVTSNSTLQPTGQSSNITSVWTKGLEPYASPSLQQQPLNVQKLSQDGLQQQIVQQQKVTANPFAKQAALGLPLQQILQQQKQQPQSLPKRLLTQAKPTSSAGSVRPPQQQQKQQQAQIQFVEAPQQQQKMLAPSILSNVSTGSLGSSADRIDGPIGSQSDVVGGMESAGNLSSMGSIGSIGKIDDDGNFERKDENVGVVDNALAIAQFEKRQQEAEQEDEPVSWLELLYSTVVESLSTADLITDALVLIEFVEGSHLWWASWMVLLILAPYMVSYVSLGSLFQKRVQRFVARMEVENGISKCSLQWIVFTFMVFLLLTPISLLYFVVIDVIFMAYVLLSSFLYFITCSKIDIANVLDDYIFSKFLGMTRMQILGMLSLFYLVLFWFTIIHNLLVLWLLLFEYEKATDDCVRCRSFCLRCVYHNFIVLVIWDRSIFQFLLVFVLLICALYLKDGTSAHITSKNFLCN